MPQGKGTYGSKVGRPPKSKKKGKSKATKASAMDMMYGAETDKMKTYQDGGYTSAMDEYKESVYGGTTSYDLETQAPRLRDWESFRYHQTTPIVSETTDDIPLTDSKRRKASIPTDFSDLLVGGVIPDTSDDSVDYPDWEPPPSPEPRVTDEDRITGERIRDPKLGDIGMTGMYDEGGEVQSSDARGRSQKIEGYGEEIKNG